MSKGHTVVGTITGTGAAINVELGFIPDYVKIFNKSDAGAVDATAEWTSDMAAASMFKGTATAGGVQTAANGITAYAGVSGANSQGFTFGADADLNVNGEVCSFIAFKADNVINV